MSKHVDLDLAFAAMAHPVRRDILARLSTGEATVNELAEPFEMSLPAISRHIKVLEEAGFITRGKSAQYRPCTINPAPLKAIASWAGQYRNIWNLRFDALEKELTKGGTENDE